MGVSGDWQRSKATCEREEENVGDGGAKDKKLNGERHGSSFPGHSTDLPCYEKTSRHLHTIVARLAVLQRHLRIISLRVLGLLAGIHPQACLYR